MISKPQKAPSKSITNEQLSTLPFPVYASPKIDGFRCVTYNAAYTSSMKLIQNKHIQSILSSPKYAGLDGELIVGLPNDPNVFNNTTGPVRRLEGEPDFCFYVFDAFTCGQLPYKERYDLLNMGCPHLSHVKVVPQIEMYSPQDVLNYEAWCVDQGFEGAMIRSMTGKYKEGRCTLKEMNIFKRKPVLDDEAEIIGFEEQMENQNEAFENELGLQTRSTHAENKVGKNTLGAFIVKSKLWKEPFRIGTGIGLTDDLRKEIWSMQEEYKGMIFTYKYQSHGSIDLPRQPIFKGFRDKSDLTSY